MEWIVWNGLEKEMKNLTEERSSTGRRSLTGSSTGRTGEFRGRDLRNHLSGF